MNGIQVGKESVHIKPTETGTVLQARTLCAHRFPWVKSQAKKATNFLTKWLDTFPLWQQHHHTEPLHKFLKEQMIDMHYSGKGLNETAAGNATLTLLPAAAGLAVLLKQLQPNCWVWQILRRYHSSQGRMNSFAKPSEPALESDGVVSFLSRYCEEVSHQGGCPSSSMRGEHWRAGAVLFQHWVVGMVSNFILGFQQIYLLLFTRSH